MNYKKLNLKKVIYRILITLAIIIILPIIINQFSPWPSALIIRYAFEQGGKQTNEKLEKHVPIEVAVKLDINYNSKDSDAKLDLYYPAEANQNLPLIVWVHGGGWVSGDKQQSSNYYKILANRGYIVASIDYTIAPEKKYPTPVKQTMTALKYLHDNSETFNINSSSIFLAGDSAGSHIVSQVANILSEPSYAKSMDISPSIERSKIKGLILYCGAYNAKNLSNEGAFGWFLNTVLWSYSGEKDFTSDPYFNTASIIDYVGHNFPPSFISAGNGDPLLSHSQELATKLQSLNVKTDTLFFDKNFKPELPHEYQFDLDVEAGRIALERSISFLESHQ
ncbi:acetyl esterase/lipase [Winogradskyella pacifica]|uniref:Acetyl esterase/lipase n=1 Tax=Winogradskyella pacifica TaxID=664642 RepID=A0A3D9LQT8_9FLAO|nr:alpha/beta hydrolase [Winogradskyella pacifica]REE08313.1 acetyl esterase/lipase [Winogradskyella pacifica]